MSIKLFDVLVRNGDQTSPVDRHQYLVNRVVQAVQKFLGAPELTQGIKVSTSIHDGGEVLHFSLSAGAQMDLFRMDTEESSQVEQEAQELSEALLAKIKALRDLTSESHLTSSRFWEILECRGFKSDELELISVASTLNLKRLQLQTANNDRCRVDIDTLLKTATRPVPIEVGLVVRYLASTHALCRVMTSTELPFRARRQIKLIWSSHTNEQEIARRLLAGIERRRSVTVKAFPVIDLAGEICGLELERFAEVKRPKDAKSKAKFAEWFSADGWPMPTATQPVERALVMT